jgi:DNA-binding Lrp family transcriptional regulator
VLGNLKKITGIDAVFTVIYGTYSIIARVKADTIDALKEILTSRVRKVPKINSTMTLTSFDEK